MEVDVMIVQSREEGTSAGVYVVYVVVVGARGCGRVRRGFVYRGGGG
jgi:hypothetical protein